MVATAVSFTMPAVVLVADVELVVEVELALVEVEVELPDVALLLLVAGCR